MDKLVDYAKIAVIAFVGIWVINYGLTKVGLDSYKA